MQIQLEGTFTIVIEKEEDGYVGIVKENNVSSFWDTHEEALKMTEEALDLWIESQLNYRVKKLTLLLKAVQNKKNTYIVKLNNSSSIYSAGNMPKTQKNMICAG